MISLSPWRNPLPWNTLLFNWIFLLIFVLCCTYTRIICRSFVTLCFSLQRSPIHFQTVLPCWLYLLSLRVNRFGIAIVAEIQRDDSSAIILLYFNILFLQWYVHFIYFPLRCLTYRLELNCLLFIITTLFHRTHMLSLARLHTPISECGQHKPLIGQWLLPAKFLNFHGYLFFLLGSTSDKLRCLFPPTTGPDFLSIFVLYLGPWQFEFSNHMFVPLKNMLQHSEVGMNRFTMF